jgi:hypothetical protein
MMDETKNPPSVDPPEDATTFVEHCHRLAKSTQNPMFGWFALQAILSAKYPDGKATDPSVSIPSWITDHLHHVADNLMMLSTGMDPRLEMGVDMSAFNTIEEAINSPEFRADVARRKIGFSNTMALVPLFMGLTRDGGWNAFEDFVAVTSKMEEFEHYRRMREQGFSSADAIESLQSNFGEKSESRRHARLREGREHLGADALRKKAPRRKPLG